MTEAEQAEKAGAGAAGPVVVVGIDGSESSVLALRWAAHLAATSGSRTLVVGVWEAYTAFGLVGEGWSALPPDWDPEKIVHSEVHHVVTHVYGDDLPPGVEVRIEQGNAARVLLDLSADAVTLVVGSRGQGGFASLLLGSVSAACAAHAKCPVLVVHGDRLPPSAPSVAGQQPGSGG